MFKAMGLEKMTEEWLWNDKRSPGLIPMFSAVVLTLTTLESSMEHFKRYGY